MSSTLKGGVIGGLVGGPILLNAEFAALSHVTFNGGPLVLPAESIFVLCALPLVLGGIIGAVIDGVMGGGDGQGAEKRCRNCHRQVDASSNTC